MRSRRFGRFPCVLVVVSLWGVAGFVGPVHAEGARYLDPLFDVEVTSDIAYGEAFNSRTDSQQTLLLDLYEPAGDPADARPVVIWIHGGSFTSGSKTNGSIVYLANEFASRGWVAVSISYRLLQPGGGLEHNGNLYFQTWTGRSEAVDAAQHDAQAAVRWLRANAEQYRVDPDRIAIGGASAGAITALQVAYNPDDPGDSGNAEYPSDVAAAVSISGFAVVKDMQPGSPPVQMFMGTHDTVVPPPLHTYTCTLARAVGGCEEVLYPEAGHVPMSTHGEDMMLRSANFLCRTVAPDCDAAAPFPLVVDGLP